MANKMNFDQPYQEVPTPAPAVVTPAVATPAPKTGMVVLRDLADSSGKALGWDASTKSVMTPGGNYTADQLKSMGGVLEGGRWMMNESVANNLLGNVAAPATADKDVLSDMLNKWGEGFVSSQTASLEQNRDADIAAIKSTLDQAVLDGKLSVREAEKQFEDQKGAIEGKAYQDAEGTALYGEEMGIKNSQQMLGVQASDKSRTNSLINSNIKDRDNKILNIKDRIASLQNKAKIDVDLAESKFRAGVTGVKGEAQMMTADKQYDFLSKDYFVDKDQAFQKDEREESQEYDTIAREDDQAWKSTEAGVQRVWESSEKRLTESHQITMQGNEFSHDAAMTAQKFRNELSAMAASAGYQSQLEDKRFKNSSSLIEQEVNSKYALELKRSSTELISAFKATNDPNSMEYKIKAAEIKNQTANNLDAIKNEAYGKVLLELELNQSPQFDQSSVDSIIKNMGGWDKLWNKDENIQQIYTKVSDDISGGLSKENALKKYSIALGTSSKNKATVQEVINSMYSNKEEAQLIDDIINRINTGALK